MPSVPKPPADIKNFVAIPQCSFKLRHIRFNFHDLLKLIAQMGLVPSEVGGNRKGGHTTASREYFTEHKDEAWGILFDINKINAMANQNQKFYDQIVIDGVSCAPVYKKKELGKFDEEKYLKEIAYNYKEKNKYEYEAYIDVGMKTKIAVVRRNIKSKVEVIKIKYFNINS